MNPAMSSIPAEQAVLGALMLNASCLQTVKESLTPADFFDRQHREIFTVLVELIEAGKPADAVTVGDYMARLKIPARLEYAMEIANNTPSASNIKAYCEIVRKTSQRRCVRDLLTKAVTVLEDPSIDTDAVTKRLKQRFEEMEL